MIEASNFQETAVAIDDGFIQRAQGTFDVILAPGTAHCGPQTSPNPLPAEFSYSVEIEYSAGTLDEKGFLLDNMDFENYFRSLREQPDRFLRAASPECL